MLDFDDFIIFYLALILIGGYSPYEAGVITYKFVMVVIVCVWMPVLFYGVFKLVTESTPIGGEEDLWWDSAKERNNIRTVQGISRIA